MLSPYDVQQIPTESNETFAREMVLFGKIFDRPKYTPKASLINSYEKGKKKKKRLMCSSGPTKMQTGKVHTNR